MAYHGIAVVLPKNNDTHVVKNYRPIALLNIMYKLYTTCNIFSLVITYYGITSSPLNKPMENKEYGKQQNNSSLINQSLMMLENITKT